MCLWLVVFTLFFFLFFFLCFLWVFSVFFLNVFIGSSVFWYYPFIRCYLLIWYYLLISVSAYLIFCFFGIIIICLFLFYVYVFCFRSMFCVFFFMFVESSRSSSAFPGRSGTQSVPFCSQKLVLCMCSWPWTFAQSPQSRHSNEGGRAATNDLRGLDSLGSLKI